MFLHLPRIFFLYSFFLLPFCHLPFILGGGARFGDRHIMWTSCIHLPSTWPETWPNTLGPLAQRANGSSLPNLLCFESFETLSFRVFLLSYVNVPVCLYVELGVRGNVGVSVGRGAAQWFFLALPLSTTKNDTEKHFSILFLALTPSTKKGNVQRRISISICLIGTIQKRLGDTDKSRSVTNIYIELIGKIQKD